MVFGIRKRIHDYHEMRRIHRSRLVTKDGRCNIELSNLNYHNKFAFLTDIWISLLQIRWRYIFLLFFSCYTLTWFFFAVLYYWAGWANGDLWWQNPLPNHKPCVWNLNGMVTAYLFSMETQTTLSYGVRTVTPYCPSGVTIVLIHCLFSGIFECMMTELILAKLILPKNRVKTITFSDKAVICPKDDFLCLKIRVANLRKTLMSGSQIYGKLLRKTATPDGKTIIIDQDNIEFIVDSGKDNLFFVCPVTLYHVIDKESPFFEMAKDTLCKQEFELVVFLDGTTEYTSASCQVRTSFIPKEILWGYNFLPIISHSKEGEYNVDFSNFSEVMPVDTAHCTYCHNNNGQHFHSISGIDNDVFEEIDIREQHNMTKM